MPPKFAAAITCFEDRRFYWHPGVDPIALARAAVQNLRGGRVVSGGSTLTMQVVRLARKGRPRTLAEKAVEAVLALRLSLSLSKRQVLGLYAAYAPFGGNTVGPRRRRLALLRARGGAAVVGRDRDARRAAERARRSCTPAATASRLLAKRNRLLDRLRERGAIDALSADLAKREPLPPAPEPLPMLAPHLVARVRAERRERRFRAGDASPWVRDDAQQGGPGAGRRRSSRATSARSPRTACATRPRWCSTSRRGDVLAYVGQPLAARRLRSTASTSTSCPRAAAPAAC